MFEQKIDDENLLQILVSAAFLTLSLANFTSILLEAFAQISLKTRAENASREKLHQTHWCKKAIHKSGKIDTQWSKTSNYVNLLIN